MYRPSLFLQPARPSHDDLKTNSQLPEVNSEFILRSFKAQTALHQTVGKYNVLKETDAGVHFFFCQDVGDFRRYMNASYDEAEMEIRELKDDQPVRYATFDTFYEQYERYIEEKQVLITSLNTYYSPTLILTNTRAITPSSCIFEFKMAWPEFAEPSTIKFLLS